jgi:hypothetical protein
MYIRLRVKYPLFLPDFNETWIFSTYFRKKIFKYQVSRKFVQWERSCYMRERQTDGGTSLFAILRTCLIKINATDLDMFDLHFKHSNIKLQKTDEPVAQVQQQMVSLKYSATGVHCASAPITLASTRHRVPSGDCYYGVAKAGDTLSSRNVSSHHVLRFIFNSFPISSHALALICWSL